MNAVIGSLSAATNACMERSRIMKFVAHVSSSISNDVHPNSKASIMLAACDVDPEPALVVNEDVSLANGRLLMKDEMSTQPMKRPSSARIFTEFGSVTMNSRPSPMTSSVVSLQISLVLSNKIFFAIIFTWL